MSSRRETGLDNWNRVARSYYTFVKDARSKYADETSKQFVAWMRDELDLLDSIERAGLSTPYLLLPLESKEGEPQWTLILCDPGALVDYT
jgi:hypothetical protein